MTEELDIAELHRLYYRPWTFMVWHYGVKLGPLSLSLYGRGFSVSVLGTCVFDTGLRPMLKLRHPV